MLAVHAQACHEPDLADALMRDYWGPRATTLSGAIAGARSAGIIASWVDDDLVRDLLFGPPIYRWLVTGVPITAKSAQRSVTAALAGIGSTQPG